MPRRRKSSKLPLIVFLILVVAAVVSGIVTTSFFDPRRTGTRLDIAEYQESPASFAGNKYAVEGEISGRLAQSPAGAVYALASDGMSLAIVVPRTVRLNFNIEKGQRLLIDIHIAKDGSAIATALSKK